MIIEIHNYLSASHLLESKPNSYDVIAILDSSLQHSEFVEQHAINSLQLKFDDITTATANKVTPDRKQIAEALEFGLKSEKLVVCCRAGQSRSAATAFTIAYGKLGEDFAIKLLNPKRHSPNYRIIQLAAELLQRHGLLETYDRWGYLNGDIRMTDYLEEIEKEYDDLEACGARDRISLANAN